MNATHWRWNDARYFADLARIEAMTSGANAARARRAANRAALASDGRRKGGAA